MTKVYESSYNASLLWFPPSTHELPVFSALDALFFEWVIHQ